MKLTRKNIEKMAKVNEIAIVIEKASDYGISGRWVVIKTIGGRTYQPITGYNCLASVLEAIELEIESEKFVD